MRRRSATFFSLVVGSIVLALLLAALGAGAGCSATKDGGGPADDATTSPDGAPLPDATTLPDGAPLPDATTLPDGATIDDTGTFDVPPLDAGPGAGLSISPADSAVILAGGKPAIVAYFAKLSGATGLTEDVTAEAVWTIDDATLGTFSGSTLTATKAGKTKVHAAARGLVATTTLLISDPVVVVLPGAPADPGSKFGGAVDGSRKPSFVYPSDGIIVPPNMNVLELHFLPGSGNTLFQLAFEGPGVDVTVYLTCTAVGSGCVYTPDATVWKFIAEGARGKDPVAYTLKGVSGTSPGAVGVSDAQKISFGQEDLTGGIYYWNAGAGATMRYEFGVSGKSGEVYMNAPMAGAGTCVGCHVLSRNGKSISLGLDIPAPSPYKVFDVATRALIYAQGTAFGGGANFFSFSPDASQIMTSNGISITLRNAKDGTAITDPLVAKGTMPDWSADGTKMVFSNPKTAPPCIGFCGAPGVDSASIDLLAFDGKSWAKSSTTLVPFSGQNSYYPAFSPDGALVVFNRSPSNANSFDAKDALVWTVPTKGGAPVQLAKASTGGDSWPKWHPTAQAYKSGKLMWLTFSSRRAYGLRLASGAQAQIWMTAIDPAKAAAGLDGSYPAFWLPFQDTGSGNHIAQWVTEVVRQPCSGPTGCGTGETCNGGRCVPTIK